MSLQYSDFEPSTQQQKNKNQTLKNRKREKSVKVQHFLESINNNDNDDENSGLHDFNEVSANVRSDYKENAPLSNDSAKTHEQETNDEDVSRESFGNLQSTYANDYYKQFIPYYNQLANSQEVSGQKDMLLEKLNYMIHLLEEQQEEKTGHITEELILYTFLGVFVIFIVDSFARAGKYVR